MSKRLWRRPSPSMVVASIALLLALTGTATAVTDAINAHKVDGKHAVSYGATVTARKGRLVATSGFTGRLPNNIVRNAGVDFDTTSLTNVNVSSAINAASVTITAPSAGWVVVRFDGLGVPATSDRLTLAASDTSQTWLPNDGNVGLESKGPFSHTRVYAVTPGTHTYYGVAQRVIGSGTGIASIYATLTVEFFAAKI